MVLGTSRDHASGIIGGSLGLELHQGNVLVAEALVAHPLRIDLLKKKYILEKIVLQIPFQE